MDIRTIPRPGGGLTIELTLSAEELSYRWPVAQSTPLPAIPQDRTCLTAQEVEAWCTGEPSQNGAENRPSVPAIERIEKIQGNLQPEAKLLTNDSEGFAWHIPAAVQNGYAAPMPAAAPTSPIEALSLPSETPSTSQDSLEAPAPLVPLPDETVLAYALRLADAQTVQMPDAQIGVLLDRAQVPSAAPAVRWQTEIRRALAFVPQEDSSHA